ncbi:hypothetical protein ONO12_28165, partial [Salmonella enterica subsp. enterica serovar Montevideo]|nr:hypothetical protein [Salmonella enterica subsp. enterica serovar Montevideo]
MRISNGSGGDHVFTSGRFRRRGADHAPH